MRLKKFLPTIVANVSAALSELLLMASAAWLIASAALHPPLSALSVGITLVRTAGISRAALRYADRFISHKIIFKLLNELREELFLRAARVFPLKSGRSHEGELLHALTIQADTLKDFLPRVILPLTTAALVTGLLTYFLFAPLKIFALILPTILLANVILAALIKIPQADDSIYREKNFRLQRRARRTENFRHNARRQSPRLCVNKFRRGKSQAHCAANKFRHYNPNPQRGGIFFYSVETRRRC